MGLIKIRVKVRPITEGDLEWDEESMGKIYRNENKEWVWKDRIIDAFYIYEITELTSNKSIIQMCDDRLILVAESLDSLYIKWQENKEKDLNLNEELAEEELIEGDEDD